MSNEERKQMAYIVGMLLKMASGSNLTPNEIQSLENIANDLGFFNINENEFRW